MSKIIWPAGTMLGPLPPAMVTCGTMEKPNVLTIAWTGIVNSNPPLTYISVRKERHSHSIIKACGEFVINLPTGYLAKACDFVGCRSGRSMDKFKAMNLTPLPCADVAVPQIAEAPVSLVCKVKSVTEFDTHDMFLAEIIHVYVEDRYLDDSGKLHLEKAGMLAFMHGAYYTLGRQVGTFGFSVRRKKSKEKK